MTYAPQDPADGGAARLAAARPRSSSARCARSTSARRLFRHGTASASSVFAADARCRRRRAAARHGARRGLADRLRRRGRCGSCGCSAPGRAPVGRGRFPARLSDAARDDPAVPRYKLTLEYDGAGLVGWQRQTHGLSVQQVVENAVQRFCGERSRFTAPAAPMPASMRWARWRISTSARRCRPSDPQRAQPSSAPARDQRARGRAASPRISTPGSRRRGRVYLYRILNRRAPAALERGRVWHVRPPARRRGDARRGRGHLVGQHDFTTFRDSLCQAKSPVKTLDALEVARAGDEIRIEARARSFLHHQVRNMVGTLELVGARQVAARRRRRARSPPATAAPAARPRRPKGSIWSKYATRLIFRNSQMT